MKYKLFILLLTGFLLTACGKDDEVEVITPDLNQPEEVEVEQVTSDEDVRVEISEQQDRSDSPVTPPGVPVPYPNVASSTENKEQAVDQGTSASVASKSPEVEPEPVQETAPESKPVVTESEPTTELKVVNLEPEIIPESDPEEKEEVEVGFTAREVATHNSEASCYTIINGSVYDVTPYIPIHPGGSRNILRICGRDGTSSFEGKHGGDEKPEEQLKSFYIGPLIK